MSLQAIGEIVRASRPEIVRAKPVTIDLQDLINRAQAAQLRMSVNNPNRLLLHQMASAIVALVNGQVTRTDPKPAPRDMP